MTPHWQTARFLIPLDQPLVMGIVNVTPDSFSDGGEFVDPRAAVARCVQLVAEGAAILDIGGESTRPGARQPSVAEEVARVLPVVREAVKLGVAVSVDTSRAEVMAAALDAGADIINDVRALQLPGALAVLAAHPAAGTCLMHMQGEPGTMQQAPRYQDVVDEVMAFLRQRCAEVIAAGVQPQRIAIDPGVGFGKTPQQNLELLGRQRQLLESGHPLLVGWSRKSTLGQITGRPVGERLAASLAAALLAAQAGAKILRVHDVAATVDVLRVWRAVHENSKPWAWGEEKA